ncbi:MAG: bifunctional folylpolyglutamate synthase/dihydrofolate synthase [Lachnospiraceae bacterium]|nr:bifunctional folylpolyglutamate synthase/dihydrofolate synthase [Lachnospiraceae bacterium]
MEYQEAVAYIYEIPKFSSKHSLDYTRDFLHRLGDPQKQFETIHVAGSNGKGSVCAMIHSVLFTSGVRVGLFTSPHLVHLTERFVVNGEKVEEETFLRAFHKVKNVVDDMVKEGASHPTFFEFIFAVGMVIFREAKVDMAVIETGLGGRLDATNVLRKPFATVITSISLEHTEYLGDTLQKIASEKAGILKQGVPVIFDAKIREVADVIFAAARPLKAPTYPVYPGDIEIVSRGQDGISFVFDLDGHKKPVKIPFVADYQVENAALAMEVCELLIKRGTISLESFYKGMSKVQWQGRMQKIDENIYLDGAHNPDGMKQFVACVSQMKEKPRRLLFSMVKEKDATLSISILSRGLAFSKIVVTEIEGARKLSASWMAEEFKKHTHAEVIVEPSPVKAFDAVKKGAEGETIFCTGSLYLIGEILKIKEDYHD